MAAQTPAPTRRMPRLPEPITPRAIRAFQLPAVLNLSRASITGLLASGDLPSFRVGRCRFVAMADIDRWIDAQRAATGR